MLFNLFIWFVQEGEKSHVSTEINSKKHSKSWRKDLFCDCNASDNVSQLSCPFSLRAESRTSSESQAPDGKFAGSRDMSVHQSLMQRITLDCSLQTTHIVLVRLSTALTKCPRGLSSREKMFVLAPILRGVSPQSLLDSACSGHDCRSMWWDLISSRQTARRDRSRSSELPTTSSYCLLRLSTLSKTLSLAVD